MLAVMTNSVIKTTLFKHLPKLHDHHFLIHHLLTRLYMILILSTSSATSITFNFPSFQQSDTSTVLETEGDAVISNQFMIQLTKGKVGSGGRAAYRKPFLLRENTTGILADFTTSFEFIIDSKSSTDNYAERLVFFLAPNGSSLNSTLEKGCASYLRLPVSSTPEKVIKLSTHYSFVAVEFDIYWNHEPNVIEASNSVDSFIAPPWKHGINVEGHRNSTSTATISYNSMSKNLSVSLFTSTSEYSGVNTKVTSYREDYMVDLEQYLPDGVVVGFSAAAGTNAFALHKIISWNFTSTSLVDHESLVLSRRKKDDPSWLVSVAGPAVKPKSRKHMIPLVALMSSVVGWFILAALLGLGVLNSCKHRVPGRNVNPTMPDLIDVECQKETNPKQFLRSFFSWAKGRSTGEDQDCQSIIDNEFEKGIGPRRFSYKELVRATNNFEDSNMIGNGGFGAVYRGFIKDLNSHVAVKKKSTESIQGIKEYVTEVRMTSQLRHRNMVKLIGWCNEKKQLLLVYEYIPRGSLDTHLFLETSSLSWEARYKIAQGLASVLHYLHEEWDQCVLHLDIKPCNILLDLNLNMKLADFGLAQLMDHGESSVTTNMVVGTYGYIAPEYGISGECSKKSDVFSFGVVALEIACGRRQYDKKFTCNMVEWIWGLYRTGKVTEAADPNLRGVFDEKQMECLLIVGLWCAYPDNNMRPLIEQAISVLNFNAPLPTLPSETPTFPSSSYQSAGQSYTSSQSSISGR